jgi:hypothetical protein
MLHRQVAVGAAVKPQKMGFQGSFIWELPGEVMQ